jgi:hypothetical protein
MKMSVREFVDDVDFLLSSYRMSSPPAMSLSKKLALAMGWGGKEDYPAQANIGQFLRVCNADGSFLTEEANPRAFKRYPQSAIGQNGIPVDGFYRDALMCKKSQNDLFDEDYPYVDFGLKGGLMHGPCIAYNGPFPACYNHYAPARYNVIKCGAIFRDGVIDEEASMEFNGRLEEQIYQDDQRALFLGEHRTVTEKANDQVRIAARGLMGGDAFWETRGASADRPIVVYFGGHSGGFGF